VRTPATIRRAALVCAGALAVLPLAALPATAQSAEDCEEFGAISEEFVEGCKQLAEQFEGDGENGDEDGEDQLEGGLRQLCDELFGALDEEAQAQCNEFLDNFFAEEDDNGDNGDEGDEVEPDPGEEEQEDPAPSPEPTPEADTTDADSSGDLPVTGGAAGLVGLALLGAGLGLRRFTARG
jgi:hypothetical protein